MHIIYQFSNINLKAITTYEEQETKHITNKHDEAAFLYLPSAAKRATL